MAGRKFRRTPIRSPRARSILTVLLMKAVRAIASVTLLLALDGILDNRDF